MSQLSDWYIHVGELGRAARFQKAAHRLIDLHDEIRRRARAALQNDRMPSCLNGLEAPRYSPDAFAR